MLSKFHRLENRSEYLASVPASMEEVIAFVIGSSGGVVIYLGINHHDLYSGECATLLAVSHLSYYAQIVLIGMRPGPLGDLCDYVFHPDKLDMGSC